jgi:hypothetical protein
MLQHATYLLLDAARMAGLITEAQTRNAAHDSLYRGTRDEALSAVAPFLFRFTPGQTFAHWYLRQGWGKSWGVLMKSSRSLEDLAKHFRNFLLVKTETGQSLYFRFYDPRVIRVFLPTCDNAQLREFFGPVDYFLVEDEDPAFVLRFWHENGVLRTQRIGVADMIASTPDVEPLPDPTEADIAAALAAMNLPAQEEAAPKAEPAPTAPQRPQPPATEQPAVRQPQPAFQTERVEPATPKPEPAPGQKKKWNLFD